MARHAEQVAVAGDDSTGDFVYVGCKLPHGIHLDLISSPGEPLKRITANGSNKSNVIGGYGITRIPRDFWDKWLSSHSQINVVKNELIFAYASERNALDAAKDRASVMHGLEPLDPGNMGKDLHKMSQISYI